MEFFNVLRLHREDLKCVDYNGDNLSDEQMERIAYLIHNNNECLMDAFWEALRQVCELEGVPKIKEEEKNNERDPMLDYVNGHIKDWERNQAWECIANRFPIPNDLSDKIYDLCEEYCMDNELPEGSWLERYMDAEDVFQEL